MARSYNARQDLRGELGCGIRGMRGDTFGAGADLSRSHSLNVSARERGRNFAWGNSFWARLSRAESRLVAGVLCRRH